MRDRTARGEPLARIVLRHARQIQIATRRQTDNACQGDFVEQGFQHELVEVGVGEVPRRVRVLARDRLEKGQDVRAAGADDRHEKPFRMGQQADGPEPALLFSGVALLIAGRGGLHEKLRICTGAGPREEKDGSGGVLKRPAIEAKVRGRRIEARDLPGVAGKELRADPPRGGRVYLEKLTKFTKCGDFNGLLEPVTVEVARVHTQPSMKAGPDDHGWPAPCIYRTHTVSERPPATAAKC